MSHLGGGVNANVHGSVARGAGLSVGWWLAVCLRGGVMNVFQSLKNQPSPDEMAVELAEATIAAHRAFALEIEAEQALAAQEGRDPRQVTPEDESQVAERMQTLAALLSGRHRAVVLPLVLDAFPELFAKVGSA